MHSHTARQISEVSTPDSMACSTVNPILGKTMSRPHELVYVEPTTMVSRSQKSLKRTTTDCGLEGTGRRRKVNGLG